MYVYMCGNFPTYFMQHSPSWEGDRFSYSQKFPLIFATRKFITAFTSARYMSISWASSNQSVTSQSTSWRSILIIFLHLRLGLPSGLSFSDFPTKTLYTHLLYCMRATCPVSLILLDLITLTISVSSTDHYTPTYVVFSTPLLPCPKSQLAPHFPLSTLFWNTPGPLTFLSVCDQVSHP